MMIGIKWASAWYNGVMVPGKESCEPLMVYELFTYWMLSMMRSLSYMHQAIIQLCTVQQHCGKSGFFSLKLAAAALRIGQGSRSSP